MFVGTGKLRRPLEHAEARRLRGEGLPYKRIAAQLGISPATAFAWTKDIELTAEQRRQNLRGPTGPLNPEMLARRAALWSEKHRARRRQYQADGRARARSRDSLHMAGCMLYWAEGGKGRNVLKLANSDPHLVSFFCRFLRDSLGVRTEEITVRLNVYTNNGISIEEIERHWLDALDLSRSCLRKHALDFKPTSSSGRRRNKLPYGVCTVAVHKTELVQHIYGAIQEYAGFEEPRWLDATTSYRRKTL
jgi:hypothetical protein